MAGVRPLKSTQAGPLFTPVEDALGYEWAHFTSGSANARYTPSGALPLPGDRLACQKITSGSSDGRLILVRPKLSPRASKTNP